MEAEGTRPEPWLRCNRAALKLCLRVTASAILTLVLSELFHLRFALWAVLTAVLLTQLNVGRSLKATTDYLAGTIGGAIFAGIVGTLIPHKDEIHLTIVLAIALMPAAFIAAANVRFGAAPFTAVLVLLAPTITHLGPIGSAFERVAEVAVGCMTGLVVSFSVLPARAYDAAIDAAARVLDLMAQAAPKLLVRPRQHLDDAGVLRAMQEIDRALAGLRALAAEGGHERMTYLASAPDLAPLLRTLFRLRDDFAMMARTAATSLPDAIQARLEKSLLRGSAAIADYLRASGAALAAHKRTVSRQAVDAALGRYADSMAVLREEDLKQGLPIEAMECVFTLAFALEQLRRNLGDLERRVAEQAGNHAGPSPSEAKPGE